MRQAGFLVTRFPSRRPAGRLWCRRRPGIFLVKCSWSNIAPTPARSALSCPVSLPGWHRPGGEELLDPVRSQYREFYIALACQLGDQPVARCPFCWVDKDFSLVRGLIQGYPKKMGSIAMTRAFSVGQATPGTAKGSQFGGTLAAAARRP